ARSLPEIIASGEYGSRYPPVRHKEIDRVIGAYNEMLQNLQRERLRLGEQRSFLEHFLAVTPTGVIIFDFDGNVSLVNPRAAEIIAVQPEVLTGRGLAQADSRFAKMLAELANGETRMITDAVGRRLRCQRSRFVDRGFSRSFILIEELTAELNRSERDTYQKLIRMMSHEVTNTVAATNSLLESFHAYASEFSNSEERADYVNALDVLIRRNRNLNEFTQGFSNLVKLPDPHLERANVGQLVDSMHTMFRAELVRRNISIDIDLGESLPSVLMDSNQIDQVMINVIKNAVEAIDECGAIAIVARSGDGNVELCVYDTGSGIAPEVKPRLFTPFHTTKKHGQGLGLTLVKEILSRHGFGYSLESSGDRTCFRIVMPASHG
ncbi:MAG TPA: ATP-binding protein, partial [Gammaproteobacteria bacterium]|nr:ATP-binding protein [Gammaproteobacteria bacterium]